MFLRACTESLILGDHRILYIISKILSRLLIFVNILIVREMYFVWWTAKWIVCMTENELLLKIVLTWNWRTTGVKYLKIGHVFYVGFIIESVRLHSPKHLWYFSLFIKFYHTFWHQMYQVIFYNLKWTSLVIYNSF